VEGEVERYVINLRFWSWKWRWIHLAVRKVWSELWADRRRTCLACTCEENVEDRLEQCLQEISWNDIYVQISVLGDIEKE
jgi:hypothetical protein